SARRRRERLRGGRPCRAAKITLRGDMELADRAAEFENDRVQVAAGFADAAGIRGIRFQRAAGAAYIGAHAVEPFGVDRALAHDARDGLVDALDLAHDVADRVLRAMDMLD